jgi:uncharacterized protein
MKQTTIILSLLLLVFAFAFEEDNNYETEIKNWHLKRAENLKKEDGWLNLAGLIWLQEGENTIGGDASNSIIFPSNHSDAKLGKVILKDGKVSFVTAEKATVFLGEEAVKQAGLFPYSNKPVVLKHQSLRWFIIQRGEKFAIRLRDLESPYLKEFKGIETFPIDKNWRIKAKFVPTVGKKIKITDITGRTYEQESPGKLVFNINGKEYSLESTSSGNDLSLVFGDLSNKHESYGGGRFLEVPAPDAEGITYIDFNKAYNPPCAFTPYATCPLPTPENKLSVAIPAGEKRYGNH